MTRIDDPVGGRELFAAVAVVLVALLAVAAVTSVAGVGGPLGGTPGALGGVSDTTVSERAVLDGTGHGPAVDPATGTASVDDDTILIRHELSTTDEAGSVGVTTEARIPDRVTELRIELLSGNDEPIEADGFDRETTDGDAEWVWDGETERPSLTYAMDANVTDDADGPLAGEGSYRFVDTGEWAIVRPPRTAVGWTFTGGGSRVTLARENAVAGEGAASRAVVFLGAHEEHVHETADQRYRLIVPEAATLEPSPDEVFQAYEGAAAALRVGALDEEVFAVAAPTGDVSWAVRGLQIGDADLWVRDAEPAGTADDVWTHEYVHTRQSYVADSTVEWFTEATATYYAALFALERGATDFDEFERTLSAGEREPFASSVLAEPGTWSANADYVKGALVAGEIDRRIRVASDGSASLATAFRDLNEAPSARDEPDSWVTNRDFLDAVEAAAAAGGDDEAAAAVRADAERLTTTDATPEAWDRDAHAEAFGETPAQVGYGLAADGIRASGEYRDRPVDRDPVRLVENESLGVDLAVSNTGGTTGSYEVSLYVDGEPVDTRSGSVEAGDETTERFEHAFADPGEYTVRVGSETLSVVVDEPGSVAVRDVSIDADRIVAGDSVLVRATVGSDGAIPAGGSVEFRVNGESVGSEPVRLDAGTEGTVEREVALDDSGAVTVSVAGPLGEASVSVQVEDAVDGDAGDGSAGGSDETAPGDVVWSVPGFGAVVAIVALLSAIAVVGRRD